MGLRAFRNIPRNLVEWSQWFSAQPVVNSTPPTRYHKITNLYWDSDEEQLVIIFNEEEET